MPVRFTTLSGPLLITCVFIACVEKVNIAVDSFLVVSLLKTLATPSILERYPNWWEFAPELMNCPTKFRSGRSSPMLITLPPSGEPPLKAAIPRSPAAPAPQRLAAPSSKPQNRKTAVLFITVSSHVSHRLFVGERSRAENAARVLSQR